MSMLTLDFAHPGNERTGVPEYVLDTSDPKRWRGKKYFADWSIGGNILPEGNNEIEGSPMELLRKVAKGYVQDAPMFGAASSWGENLVTLAHEVAKVDTDTGAIGKVVKDAVESLAETTFGDEEKKQELEKCLAAFSLPAKEKAKSPESMEF